MTKPSSNVYLVFAHRTGYLVAVDLHDPQTPLGFRNVIAAHKGEQGIFEEVARASPAEAMKYALPYINAERTRHNLPPAEIRPYIAAERPASADDGQKVVAFPLRTAVQPI